MCRAHDQPPRAIRRSTSFVVVVVIQCSECSKEGVLAGGEGDSTDSTHDDDDNY